MDHRHATPDPDNSRKGDQSLQAHRREKLDVRANQAWKVVTFEASSELDPARELKEGCDGTAVERRDDWVADQFWRWG